MKKWRHCFYCGDPLTRKTGTRDHLQPSSRNGTNDASNIVLACKPCNASKGNMTLEEFRLIVAFRRGLLKAVPKLKFCGEESPVTA
jgi:5-methylcytosine-specific restriction endonuclease McrA